MAQRVRIVLFDSDPCAMLLFSEDASVALPALTPPFTKKSIADAIAEVHGSADNFQISVMPTAGRYTAGIARMRNASKAERASRQLLTEIGTHKMMLGATGDIEKERSRLMLEKHEVDDLVRGFKAQIHDAKAARALRGEYMNAAQFRLLETELAAHQKRSLAIQNSLSELKRRRVAADKDDEPNRHRRFVELAREYMSRDEYMEIWDMVRAEREDPEERAEP